MTRELIPSDDPRLREVSVAVDWANEDRQAFYELLRDMREIMVASGAVGIAAPQVGVNKRVIIVYSERHGEFLELINPRVWYSPEQTVSGEGCLSLPEVECDVKRSESVVCTWTTPDGRPQMFLFQGLSAMAVQHEVDHLNGVLMIDRT